MVIDFHVHVFPPFLRDRRGEYVSRDATFGALYSSPGARMATAEELVESMDRAGVEMAVAVGIGWTDRELATRVNDYVMDAAMRFSGRIVPFCGVNPAWGEDALRELRRCVQGGARGVGELHADSQGFDVASREVMAPLMEEMRNYRMPVLVHSSEPVGHLYPGKGNTTPARLLAFIREFPQNVIVCAHWGGGLPFYALMPEVSELLGNVYFDSAASPFLYTPEVFPVAVGLVGAGRILFGTDYPLIGHQRLLEQVRQAGLPPEVEEAVLGGNAARLLGLKKEER